MVMGWIFTGMVFVAVVAAVCMGKGQELAAAIPQGAQSGITLVISMAGSVCLWTGIGSLMEKTGVTERLSRLLKPALGRLFPSSKKDPSLAGSLSANICANFLGLGNAATPMGIRAVERFAAHSGRHAASDEMCRLVVLNTASIQLIPATVAAVRASFGCQSPFDILPAVWVTSLCSAFMGLLAAWVMGKLWKK